MKLLKMKIKKGAALFMALLMVLGTIQVMPRSGMVVKAEESTGTEKTIAGLGTGIIANPTAPTSTSDVWTGSYVYFGTYSGSPVKYRVLDSNTTVFGGTTMLLDCDSILWTGSDPGGVFSSGNINEWAHSDIRRYLNETFLTNNFSTTEQNAIAKSTKSAADSSDGDGWSDLNYVELNNDKIFLLDAKEATNESYGYSYTDWGATNRVKKIGGNAFWWLRSTYLNSVSAVGAVYTDGSLSTSDADFDGIGVSPALNVKLSSVLFASVSSGTAGEVGAEYKLTLLDENMTIVGNGEVTRTGDTVTIPYAMSGSNSANATQVSVLLLDKEYTEGNTNDAEVLYYGALDTSVNNSSTGTFTLPSDLSDKVCERDYYAYIIAEDVNGTYETDYASEPVEITNIPTWISRVDVTIDTPKGNMPFDTTAECDTVGVANVIVKWTNMDGIEQSGNAEFYPWTYIANFTFIAEEGYTFSSTPEVVINNGDILLEYDGVTLNTDGTLSVKTADILSSKDKLISITVPQSIIVANGTAYGDMGLPTTVTIVTEGNTVTTADVAWNTTTPASGSYDPAILTEQTVILNGTVTCPANVDVNGVELNTTISITISAAGIVGTPTVNPVAGTYTENQSVVLTTTTDGATIYYTTDGTTPSKTNGTKYTAPITVLGAAGQSVETTIKAIAVKDGMQDSSVETFEYTINIPMPKHTITATAGANGSITPSGAVEVTEGESKTFTITADEGYEIATMKVDGVDVAVETSYTFTNVTDDHTIAVTFKQKATPDEPIIEAPVITSHPQNASAKSGETATFTITATGTTPIYQWQINRNDGKGFVNITGANSVSYTTSAVDASCNGFKYQCVISNSAGTVTSNTAVLTVTDDTEEKTSYTITATAGANGSITPSGAVEVTEGESKTFTITADEGYEIDTLKVDGADVTVETSYTFTNVTADHTIAVTFKQKETPEPDPVDYEIIEGEDETWILDLDGNLTIKGNGDFSKFVGVKVDGNLLDTKYYTAKEGSTIITLKAEYLNTLSVGSHTFEIVWNDGSASTSFTIKEDEIDDIPDTGDTSNPLWFILLLVSGAGLLLTGLKGKYAFKKED